MILSIKNNLELKLFTSAYAQQVFDLVKQNEVYLMQWLPWIENMKNVDFIENYIVGSMQRNFEGEEYAFVICYNGQVAGRIGLYKIDTNEKSGEIGYWISEKMQGKGIVTSSTSRIIKFGFDELNLNKLVIHCGSKNYKSKKIPEMLHFKHINTIINGETVKGRNIDLEVYELTKEQFLIQFQNV